MSGYKGQYDMIASLGGNCSAAHNLRFRNLRTVSLPFDWLYIVDERPIYWFAEYIGNNLSGFCLKENLIEISPDSPEWSSSHPDRIQYIDSGSGYRFVNHFNKRITDDEEYQRVYGTLMRRVTRFIEKLSHAKRALLILATPVNVSDSCFCALRKSLTLKFPKTEIDIVYMKFGVEGECPELIADAKVHIIPIPRSLNDYDFLKTNYEWSWLDQVSVSDTPGVQKRKTDIFHFSFGIWPGKVVHFSVKNKGCKLCSRKNMI